MKTRLPFLQTISCFLSCCPLPRRARGCYHVPLSSTSIHKHRLQRMRLRLLYHGHCFDGVASAATFARFYRARLASDAEVSYAPLLHTAGALFDETMFDGDENAIVDFKYSPSERLT